MFVPLHNTQEFFREHLDRWIYKQWDYLLTSCIFLVCVEVLKNYRINHMYQYLALFLNNYSETWELGTPKGLWKTVLNSEVVLFLRFISMYWIGLGTEVAVLNSQVVPISQVVLKTGFTVYFSIMSTI